MGRRVIINNLPRVSWLLLILLAKSAAATSSDDQEFAKAKEECGPQLAGLAPCLSYVGGSAKTPTMDCCTGLKQVLAASKKCVCLLVKYKDEPSLGVKFDVNRALSLPSICQSAAKLTECPTLLHLSPNSPEAKMFANYDKSTSSNATSTTTAVPSTATATPANSTSSDSKANGSSGSMRAPTAVFYGLLLGFMFLLDL
ncbi:hypothetical protein V2J09_022734 [Rumex salicifolius]